MKRLLLIVFILLIIVNKYAYAASYTWTGNTNTNWSTNSNWAPTTGHPIAGDAVSIPSRPNMPTVDVNSACASINVTASATLTLAASLTVSGNITYTNNNDVLTFAGTGSASFNGLSMGYNGSVVIGANDNITFTTGSIVTMQGNLTNTWTNNGTLTFTSSTLNFANVTTLTNNGTLNFTSSTINFPGNSNVIDNFGTLNATASTFNVSSQNSGIKNESTGTVTGTGSTFKLSANNAFISNAHNITLTSCPLTLSAQDDALTNTGTNSTFRISSSAVVMGPNNNINITNGAGAYFIIDGGSSVSITSYNGFINNSGTFYDGTSNSSCVITTNNQNTHVINNSTGTFYVGSTSGITPGGYSAYVQNKGFFIFQSDQYGSGYIGTLVAQSPASNSPTFNVSGNTPYYVERYITANRGYRFGSSPVYTGAASGNNIFTIDYLKNTIWLTGDAGGGFDKTGNPTIYLFRENYAPVYTTFYNSNFMGIASLNSSPTYTMDNYPGTYNIPVGNGFQFFFRGDKAAAPVGTETQTNYVPTTATLTAIGSINQGSVTVHDWYTPTSALLGFTATPGNTAVQGDNLVGNPYPCSIDWDLFSSTTATAAIYGPNINNATYSYNYSNKNFATYINGVGNNGGTHIIPSGQGFLVYAKNASASLTFTEAAKTTAQVATANLLMGKSIVQANFQYLKLQMAMDSVNTDETTIQFKGTAKPVFDGEEDALYMPGGGAVSVSSKSTDKMDLAVNVFPLPKQPNTVIPVSINAQVNGNYELSLKQIIAIPRLYDVWLMDAYKKDSIELRANHSYKFDVAKTDSSTFGSRRFSLVLRQNPNYAYQLLSFTGDKLRTSVQLVWKTLNEQNYTNFTVERSIDGKTFTVIGGVPSNADSTYSLLDKNPKVGENDYRLKQEDINNAITYSNVVKIFYSDLSNQLSNAIAVYPNPAKSILNVDIKKFAASNTYNIVIENSSGMIVKQAVSGDSAWHTSVADLLPGTYMIQVINNKDKSVVGKLKFLKI